MREPNQHRNETTGASESPIGSTSFGSAARAIAVGVASFLTATGSAEAGAPLEPERIVSPALSPRATTNLLLERRLSIDTSPLPLDQLLGAVTTLSGVKVEALWARASDPNGLSKDFELGLSMKNRTVREVLEKIGEALEAEGKPATWQVLQDGRLQFGAKESLNRFQERRIIDPRDLTAEAPIFDGAPDFNLNGALTQGRGGGGGSIIGEPGESSAPRRTTNEGVERLKEIILETVEPEQWSDAGGSGGTIRIYNGTLFVQAAPYILRAL